MEELFLEIVFCQVPHSFSAQSIAETIICSEQIDVSSINFFFLVSSFYYNLQQINLISLKGKIGFSRFVTLGRNMQNYPFETCSKICVSDAK